MFALWQNTSLHISIIENQIPKVVIATLDPNPIVKGEGVQTLIKHGVQVKTTICETEAKMLNKRFLLFTKKDHI